MKLNWGTGIVIAMISFMIFILTFVYRSVVMDEYQHELVSEDYYGDELHYQEEIDKLKNASNLETDVALMRSNQVNAFLLYQPTDKSQHGYLLFRQPGALEQVHLVCTLGCHQVVFIRVVLLDIRIGFRIPDIKINTIEYAAKLVTETTQHTFEAITILLGADLLCIIRADCCHSIRKNHTRFKHGKTVIEFDVVR